MCRVTGHSGSAPSHPILGSEEAKGQSPASRNQCPAGQGQEEGLTLRKDGVAEGARMDLGHLMFQTRHIWPQINMTSSNEAHLPGGEELRVVLLLWMRYYIYIYV